MRVRQAGCRVSKGLIILPQEVVGYLDIECRGFEPLVPEQHLYHADIHLLFEEVSGKAVQEDPMTRRCT